MMNNTARFTAQRALARPDPARDAFARDLTAALATRPRSISPKYFYDVQGSALFDRICDLPEYYPTRTEMAILRGQAGDIAAQMGPRAEIVEFGAGSCTKVRLLLDAMDAPARYLPIDISGEHLSVAAAGLRRDYPGLDVQPVVADYTQRLLLAARPPGAGQRVGFFPGSTIGNFTPAEAFYFLQVAAQVLRGGALLLGADLVKDPAVLHAAYNDAQGVTAAFNLNLLLHVNRLAGTDFRVRDWQHVALYDTTQHRIEMHLQARSSLVVQTPLGPRAFRAGERIHTENSYKWTVPRFAELLTAAGFSAPRYWLDADSRFAVFWAAR